MHDTHPATIVATSLRRGGQRVARSSAGRALSRSPMRAGLFLGLLLGALIMGVVLGSVYTLTPATLAPWFQELTGQPVLYVSQAVGQ